MLEDDIGRKVVHSAYRVHRDLGPGLIESVYEIALAYELREQGVAVDRQVSVPLVYRGIRFDEGFRIDLLVESKVILEIKSIEAMNNAHRKQLLTYLRLSGHKLGFLLNFGQALMKQGIVRMANRLAETR